MNLEPIGTIETPFEPGITMPIQSVKSQAIGTVILKEEFMEGLHSVELFSHLTLIYWFHKTKPTKMMIRPFLDTIDRGVFSTRAPTRPNPIGVSTVEIVSVEGNKIIFRGADMLNGTPLLDIKPFVPEFDNRLEAGSGWLAKPISEEGRQFTSDERFYDSDQF
jgi:tRNA-Thr(GGU) m(6)t(6)A37 methyltransferase TsaA